MFAGATSCGGQVTLAADPGYFRNIVWRQTGVAAFAVPLFLAGRRGAIGRDEIHQRVGRGGEVAVAGPREGALGRPRAAAAAARVRSSARLAISGDACQSEPCR